MRKYINKYTSIMVILLLMAIIITFTYISYAASDTTTTVTYDDINGELDTQFKKYITSEEIPTIVQNDATNNTTTNVIYKEGYSIDKYKILQNPHKGSVVYTGISTGYGFNTAYKNTFINFSSNGYARLYWYHVVRGIDENGNLILDWTLVDNAIQDAVKKGVKMSFRAFATYSPYVYELSGDTEENLSGIMDSCSYDDNNMLRCNTKTNPVKYVVPKTVVDYCNSKTQSTDSNSSCGEVKSYYLWNNGNTYEQWIPDYRNKTFQSLTNQLIDSFANHLSTTDIKVTGKDGVLGDYVEYVDIGTYGIYGEEHLGYGSTFIGNTNQNTTSTTYCPSVVNTYSLTSDEFKDGYIQPFINTFKKYTNLKHILLYNAYGFPGYNLDYNRKDTECDYTFTSTSTYKSISYNGGDPCDENSYNSAFCYQKMYMELMQQEDNYNMVSQRSDGFIVNNSKQKPAISFTGKVSSIRPTLFEYALPGHDVEGLTDLGYFNTINNSDEDYHIKNWRKIKEVYNAVENSDPTYLELITWSIKSGDSSSTDSATREITDLKYKIRDLYAYLGNRLGYYFKIKEATYPTSVENNTSFDLKVTINNDGVTKLYNNAYLYVAFLDSNNKDVKTIYTKQNANTWNGDSVNSITIENINTTSLSEGRYKLAIGLVDEKDKNNNSIVPSYLFGSSMEVTDDKWHVLGAIQVGEPDENPPTITASQPTHPVRIHTATITVSNGTYNLNNTNSYQYYLSTSSTSLTNGSWTDYTSGFQFSIGQGLNGNRYLFVKTIKDVWNLESSATNGQTVTIDGETYHRFGPYTFDNENPTCNISLSPSTWTNSNVTLEVAGSDSVSTSDKLTYSFDNITFSAIRTNSISENNTYRAYVKDEAGNIGQCSIDVNKIDKTLPEVTFITNGTSTYSKSVSTKVDVSDISDIKEIKYLWIQGEQEPDNIDFTNTITNGDTINKNTGTGNDWYLWILAVDNAENTTKKRSNAFMLDNTPPGITIAKNQNSLTITANDYQSGLHQTPFSWDGVNYTNNNTLTIEENGTYTAYVRDALGNVSKSSITVKDILHQEPTIKVNDISTTPVKSHNVSIKVEKGTEELNSFNQYQYYLSTQMLGLNGGSWTDYTNDTQFTIGNGITGIRYLYVKTVRDVNNLESISSSGDIVTIDNVNYHRFGPYIFDNNKPTCTLTKTPETYTNQAVTLTINGKDETSTINLAYSIDNINFNLTRTTTVSKNSTYTAYVKDEAGNIGQCSTNITNIDNKIPEVVFETNGTTTYSKSVSAKVTANDDAGIKSLKYLWYQGELEPDSIDITNKFKNGDIITKSNGTGNNWYLWIMATDNSGNTTKIRSNAFMLDNTNPICTINKNGLKLKIIATDVDSGLSDEPYSWDNKTFQATNTLEITQNGTYTSYVKDKVGNIGNCEITPEELLVVPDTSVKMNKIIYIIAIILISSGIIITGYTLFKNKAQKNQ